MRAAPGELRPPRPIRELRDLTRYRKTLIKERQREANRLHKVLEDAGIKLACVATDVLGVSGRAMTTTHGSNTTTSSPAASPANSKPSATEYPSSHSQPDPTRFSDQALRSN